MQISGRRTPIKVVIMARPIHQLLVVDTLVWLLDEINKWIRAFLWAGKEKVNRGQCLVACQNICKPISFGGLGIKNLNLQATQLRCVDDARLWQAQPVIKVKDATEVFNNLVAITVGDGAKTLFWTGP